jgi:hypothetical protein
MIKSVVPDVVVVSWSVYVVVQEGGRGARNLAHVDRKMSLNMAEFEHALCAVS